MPTLPRTAECAAPTVGDGWRVFLEDFAQLVRRGVRSSATLAMHQEFVEDLSEHLPRHTALDTIDEGVISCIADAEQRGRRVDAKGERIPASTSTVAKRLSTLSGMLKAAHRRAWIPRVPAFPHLACRPNPQPDHFRTLDELELLCATLPRDWADWMYLATFTGQHPADVNAMRAYVDADPFASPPWFRRRNTKNRKRDIVVEMATPLAERLRARFTELGLKFGAALVPEWGKDARGKALRLRRKRLGLMNIRATSGRHTFATWAAHALRGITSGLVTALGHGSPRMAESTYVHALPAGLAEVAAALSAPPRAARKASATAGRLPAAAEPDKPLRKKGGR